MLFTSGQDIYNRVWVGESHIKMIGVFVIPLGEFKKLFL